MAEKILKKYLSDDVVHDLNLIIKSSSDNIVKSGEMADYMRGFGFKKIGIGTNRLAMTHKKHPGLVFKFALDSFGLTDNQLDIAYSEEIYRYVTCYESSRTGLVSVHDFVEILKSKNQAKRYYKDMNKILKKLSKEYLLADVSLRTFRNFGLIKKGKKKILVLADGSDLVRLADGIKLRCPNTLTKSKTALKFTTCNGKLEYDEEFFRLVCKDCGKEYNPSDLKKFEIYKGVDVLKDKFFSVGFSPKELDQLNNAILKKRNQVEPDRPDIGKDVDDTDSVIPVPISEEDARALEIEQIVNPINPRMVIKVEAHINTFGEKVGDLMKFTLGNQEENVTKFYNYETQGPIVNSCRKSDSECLECPDECHVKDAMLIYDSENGMNLNALEESILSLPKDQIPPCNMDCENCERPDDECYLASTSKEIDSEYNDSDESEECCDEAENSEPTATIFEGEGRDLDVLEDTGVRIELTEVGGEKAVDIHITDENHAKNSDVEFVINIDSEDEPISISMADLIRFAKDNQE